MLASVVLIVGLLPEFELFYKRQHPRVIENCTLRRYTMLHKIFDPS